MLGFNQANFTDFYRSDIAWKDAKYAQIWEYLRDEFELTQRFASLDFKLKFVEVKFLFSELVVYHLNECNVSIDVHAVVTSCFLFTAQYPLSSGNSSE